MSDSAADQVETIDVVVDGVRIRSHRSGDVTGQLVVILHGFTGSAKAMAPVVDRLRPNHQVVAVDLVGHGGSDAPDDVAPYSMPACVAQVVGVLDQIASERAHVIGYSMGGRAALSLAVQHPERVASLHLVGATAGLRTEAERVARRAADDALADRLLTDGLEAFVDHWMSIPLFASQVRLGGPALAAARADRLTANPLGLANSLRGMGTGSMPPLHERLGDLAVPVQLIVGEEDEKFHTIARDLASLLPDATVTVIAEAGHAAHLESPDAVAAAIRTRLT